MDANTKTESKESGGASPTELFSSVQVLGQAAVSTFNNQSDKVDKAKAAGAAEDVLQAASQYGKLENTSYGTYIEKAEGYLHQYSQPGDTKAATGTEQAKTDAAPASKEGDAPAAKESNTATEPEKKEESSTTEGIGSYVKIAEGLVNKEGGGSGAAGESGGGLGGALKMAQGLWK